MIGRRMSNKIYVECPNCGHDISVELGEHDKQVREDAIDDLIDRLHHFWNDLNAYEVVSLYEVFDALDAVRAEQIKEEKRI